MVERVVKKRLLEEGSRCFFLLGPLGVGKSSLCRETFPDSIQVDLRSLQVFIELSTYPEKLNNLIPEEFCGWVILEEIQRLPILLKEVFQLIKVRQIKFILTVSSMRCLKKQGIGEFSSKASFLKLFPLTAFELKKQFDLQSALEYGLLPEVYLKKDLKLAKSYLDTYLEQEVMGKRMTRDVGAFSRFLQALGEFQGEVLNLSEIARETAIHRKVIEDYISILEDLLLIKKIPVFQGESERKLISHPKFFFFDVGIYRSLCVATPFNLEARENAVFKTLVYQELRALNRYLNFKYQISFWKSIHQLEVDFILQGSRGLIAIGLKRSDKVVLKDLKGLLAFKKDYPQATLFLFYRGEKRKSIHGVELIPLAEALFELPQIL